MGTNGAAGHVVEYAGDVIRGLSMEQRMTICNMTIEGGGRAGMIAPDDTTFEWVEGRAGRARRTSRRRCADWRDAARPTRARRSTARSTVDAAALSPLVTWGTNPGQVVGVADAVPEPSTETDERSLVYMGLEAGTPIAELKLDRVFIGSCTNARIGDLRAAAEMVKGRKVASDVRRDGRPRLPAGAPRRPRREGLDEIFRAAGFDWRTAGCSMCLGMNPDILGAGRALRVDLQPQLRGPPGPRRAHPPRLARRWPPRPRSRATSSTSGSGTSMDAVKVISGPVTSLDARRRRHRPDHPQAVPQADRAHRLRRVPVLRLGAGARLVACPRTRSSPPARTSAAARAASTRPGRCRTTASRRSSRRRFADIFFSNCTKIGLLPVVLPEEEVRALMEAGEAEVDLEALEVRFDGRAVPFELDAERRHRLLNGLDDIALTLQKADDIAAYEAERERPGPVTLNLVGSRTMPNIALLPGDGIGPEVAAAAVEVLDAVAADLDLRRAPRRRRRHRRARRRRSPTRRWRPARPPTPSCSAPSAARSGTRTSPAPCAPSRACSGCAPTSACTRTCARSGRCRRSTTPAPLKRELIEGVDMLIVRELTGGLYYGERGTEDGRAFDTMVYTVEEIERIARAGFEAAKSPRDERRQGQRARHRRGCGARSSPASTPRSSRTSSSSTCSSTPPR